MTREEIPIIKTPEQRKAHQGYVDSLKREEIEHPPTRWQVMKHRIKVRLCSWYWRRK